MTKKTKSKVNKKILNKEIDYEFTGIDIANNSEAKRRKVELKTKEKKQKKIKPEKQKKQKAETPKKTVSYAKFKIRSYMFKVMWLIFIMIFIVSLVIFIKNRHILGITLKTEVDKKDSVIIELATGNNDIYAYQSEILVYSNGIIKTYDKYGKKTWEYKFEEMFNPEISINGKYLQITNKDNGYIYVFENGYEAARIKIDGDIKKANINKNGDTAVLYSSSGVKAAIGIYNKKGKELNKIKPKDANVANFMMSDSSRYLAYTEVIMEGITISENINIVDTSKGNIIKNIKSITSEIVYGLDLNEDILELATDKAVYRYNINTGKTIEEKLDNKNIIYLDYENKNLAVISKEINSEAKSQLVIKNINNKKQTVINIEDVPKDFKYVNNLSYIVYQKQIAIYNNYGKKIKGYTSDNIIVKIEIFNDGKSVAVPYSNKIEIINI